MLFTDITVIDGKYEAKEHCYLRTEAERIVAIDETAPKGYDGPVYDGRNKVAMPGFFNAHCHLPMTLLRGYGEGLPLDRWLNERMFPFEDLMGPEDMYWGSLLAIAELQASGAVAVSDMYMDVEAIAKAVLESGFKANLSRAVASPAPGTRFANTKAYEGSVFLARHNRESGCDRLRGDAAVHAEYTTDAALVRDVVDFAKENGMRMQLHLSETRKEHEGCKKKYGVTPAAWFDSLGAFDVPATAAHCVWLEEDDMALLAGRSVTVAHCPQSNLKLGSGIAPVAKMRRRGIPVAIGTDGAASNNNLNALEEVTTASLLQKGAFNDPMLMDGKTTLEMACRNGALAQGRGDCGALQVGNRADIVVYDLDKPHLQPVYDVLANILYAASAGDVALTMVDGEVLYQNGEHKRIDIEQALWHARRIRQEKLEQLEK